MSSRIERIIRRSSVVLEEDAKTLEEAEKLENDKNAEVNAQKEEEWKRITSKLRGDINECWERSGLMGLMLELADMMDNSRLLSYGVDIAAHKSQDGDWPSGRSKLRFEWNIKTLNSELGEEYDYFEIEMVLSSLRTELFSGLWRGSKPRFFGKSDYRAYGRELDMENIDDEISRLIAKHGHVSYSRSGEYEAPSSINELGIAGGDFK